MAKRGAPGGKRELLACAAMAVALAAAGCAKNVKLAALPMARGGSAEVKVELTYDRNNTIELKLGNVPEPSTLKPEYTRYVLWAATPDKQRVTNIGQLRLDDEQNAEITTLTPLRSFVLLVTAEAAGDTATPGPDVVFESETIEW
jgi:hypothetical protein